MTLFVYSHDAGTLHDAGPGHPEAPIRLERVLAALDDPGELRLRRLEAERVDRDELVRVHTAAHVASILEQVPSHGRMPIDMDTWLSPHSGEAALRAAGAAVQATRAVLTGETRRAFVAMRPPGHHAEPAVAMGFCLFNNIAVAAAHALEVHGLERVAVIDFDVHHGNGTQAIFETRPNVLYASIHQAPLFPGTGRDDERGLGNIVNTCVGAGTDGRRWRRALEDRILPAIDGFAPELVLVSAGFDAHAADPLAQLDLDEDDFAWVTERVVELAERHAGGRVVSALEGGYDPDALVRSVMAHLQALEDRS